MGFLKQGLSLGLAVLLCAGLTGCGQGSGDGKVIYANLKEGSGFTGTVKTIFEGKAQSAGVQVEYYDAKSDGNLQIDQMNEAIAKHPRAIILLAADSSSIVASVKKANEAGIPVITVNREVSGAETIRCLSDDTEAGRMQGEYMAKHLPQGAKVVYLKGAGGQASSDKRWEGFKAACLDKRPDIKLLAMADAGWSRAEALKTMSMWMTLFPEINAVVAGNDEMALGAVAALKSGNRLTGVLVSGIDANKDGLKAIQAGEMVQTIKQDAEGQADGALKLVQQCLQGQVPKDGIIVPFTEITRDNLSQFLK